MRKDNIRTVNREPLFQLWLVTGLLLLNSAAHADEIPLRPNPLSVVPSSHWSVQAEEHLARIGVLECGDPKVFETRPTTRYEMAVGVARLMSREDSLRKLAPVNADPLNKVDPLSVRDILVALVFEYRDELMELGVQDPMTSGSYEIEAYFQTKAELPMNASDWFLGTHQATWNKDYAENLFKAHQKRELHELRVPAPPRLTITPSILTGPNIPKTPIPQPVP